MGGIAYVESESNADLLAQFIIGRLAHLGPQMSSLGISYGNIGSVEKWRGRAYERPWSLYQISSPLIELMELEEFDVDCNEPGALKKLMKWENRNGEPIHAEPVPWVKHINDFIDTGVRRAIGATMHFNHFPSMSEGLPITDYKKLVEGDNWRIEYGCRNQLVYDGRVSVSGREFFNKMKEDGAEKVLEEVGPSYTFIMMGEDRTVFGRDPLGLTFLCYAEDDGTVALSTETRALDMVGFDVSCFGHVPPGSVGVIEDGELSIDSVVSKESYTPHSFGWDYGNRPKSHLDGVSIKDVRLALGRTLSELVDFKEEGVVSYPPRSPYFQAVGFAEGVGVEVTEIYDLLLQGREYLQGNLDSRKKMSNKKLKFKEDIKDLVGGRPVYLVDDSIVSGAHMGENARDLYGVGASEVHLVITSPPFVQECPFGPYVPPKNELAAVRAAERLGLSDVRDYVYDEKIMRRVWDELGSMIGADSVTYMPLKRREELFAGFSGEFGSLKDACMHCFGRPLPEYPDGVSFK